jgi:hypothetical protein
VIWPAAGKREAWIWCPAVASSDDLRFPLYCGDGDRPAIATRCGEVVAAGAIAGSACSFRPWGELLGRDPEGASVGCCHGDGMPRSAVGSQVVMGRNASRITSRITHLCGV